MHGCPRRPRKRWKDALENKTVPVNRGWKILKAIQELPPEEQESAVEEMLAAVREIDQLDAEVDAKHKIASLFCKAYEQAVLLTPTLKNIRLWVECTRIRPDEVENSVKESYELAQTFQTIGDLLKNEILNTSQQAGVPSNGN